MTYAAALLSLACFAIALRAFSTLSVATKAIETSRTAAKVMRDPALSDLEKEKAIQKSSFVLLGHFFSILGRAGAAVAISLVPLFIFQTTGVANFSSVSHLLMAWQGIVLASVVMSLTFLVRRTP